jgi:hypothetical protein
MTCRAIKAEPRKCGGFAVMVSVTERVGGGTARRPSLASSRADVGGRADHEPAYVSSKTVAHTRHQRGVEGCQRDWQRAKSRSVSAKAVAFGTSLSCPAAPNLTPNISPTSAQAGVAASSRCGRGATRRIAPTATLTASLSLFAKISAIGASFPFTSRAIPTCRVIARSRRTLPARRHCLIAWNRTEPRHVPTTKPVGQGGAA